MKDRYTLPILLLVFVVLAAGIVAAGCLLYRSQREGCRTEAEHNLAAIADLKVRNIVDWREERLGDAQTIMLDEFLGPAGTGVPGQWGTRQGAAPAAGPASIHTGTQPRPACRAAGPANERPAGFSRGQGLLRPHCAGFSLGKPCDRIAW